MSQLKWFWTVLVLAGLFVHSLATSCASLDTPGVTIPKGDIVLEHGSSLEIFCILNTSHPLAFGRNSSHLVFYHNDKLVLREFVHVVNDTTLRLYVEKPPLSKSMYYCKLQSDGPDRLPEDAVCLNHVVIAHKPPEVINFTCISHNWENLTCSWIKPFNFISTKYHLGYRLPGRAGRRILYGCPNNLGSKESRCFWDFSTDPLYRQPYEYYYFNMTGENQLGNVSFPIIKFHHYSHVIPAAPQNLAILNKTSESVCIEWTVPYPMLTFPPGVISKVKYQSEWDSRDTWNEEIPMKTKTPNNVLNVTNLKYANSLYDIKVYMKSAAASVNGEMWSIPANLTVKTLATVPGSAPKTDVGSFEVSGTLPSRDIYIYWQQIPEYLKNGEDFKYLVYKLDEHGNEHAIEPQESSKAYAKLTGMGLSSHKFVVVSHNKNGRSRNQSMIYIPSLLESPPEPLSFTKITFSNGTYELSWKAPPQRSHNIVNYTIFWCNNDRDRPYQCTGYLQWEHVSKDVMVKKIQVPDDKVYQFAISTNTVNGSSGMVWASCTVIHDKIVGKMKNVWINQVAARWIEVGWKLECSDRVGMVTGYRISYCPIVEPTSANCKEPLRNTTISGDSSTIRGQVHGLRPYTTYMVSVGVVTKNGGGMFSDVLMNTTREAAPDTPPSKVHVSEVTNSSAVIDWEAPLVKNGHLRHYFVYYNGEAKIRVDGDKRHLHLKNLSSYTNYTIAVVACTVECSTRSDNITVLTAMGEPGEVMNLFVSYVPKNHSLVNMVWNAPVHGARGRIFYEVMVSHEKNGANVQVALHNTTTTKTQIPIDCQGEGVGRTYVFAVRGINVATNNDSFSGPWSTNQKFPCFNAALETHIEILIWILSFVLFSGICVLLGYAGKRAWLRCKMMQDVEVKLPPGLASLGEKDNHMHSWPTNDNRDPHKSRPSADEELLLQKKCGDGAGSGGDDSSGCSSGHESVSSSLTAGTNMSTDSGTEADQRAASPDGVFSECCSLRPGEPYVRLGKLSTGSVARSTPNLSELDAEGSGSGLAGTGWSSTGYISMQGSSEDMEATENYCRVGRLDPQPANKGYVSIASMPTAPSNYIAHSAYVPNTSPLSSPDPYCRMGVSTPGYVPLGEARTGGGYVPHGKFDKQEDLFTSVFAPATSDPHTKSPTTSV